MSDHKVVTNTQKKAKSPEVLKQLRRSAKANCKPHQTSPQDRSESQLAVLERCHCYPAWKSYWTKGSDTPVSHQVLDRPQRWTTQRSRSVGCKSRWFRHRRLQADWRLPGIDYHPWRKTVRQTVPKKLRKVTRRSTVVMLKPRKKTCGRESPPRGWTRRRRVCSSSRWKEKETPSWRSQKKDGRNSTRQNDQRREAIFINAYLHFHSGPQIPCHQQRCRAIGTPNVLHPETLPPRRRRSTNMVAQSPFESKSLL